MAKKFAEITGIHKIFSANKIPDETGNSEYKYNTFKIDAALATNIDKNTIIFVTADNTDVDRIIGPNDYKISKDDCFIVSQNKVYATFGKVNVSDVMGPAGKDGVGVYSLTYLQKANMIYAINDAKPSLGISMGDLVVFLKAIVDGGTGLSSTELNDINSYLKNWSESDGINGSFIIDSTLFTRDMNDNNFKLQNYYDLKGDIGPIGPIGDTGATGADGETPHIDTSSGNWFIGSKNTGVEARGPKGDKGDTGATGADGETPHIDTSSGNWFIGSKNTGVHAQGPTGPPGKDGASASMPVGSVIMFAGDNPPQSWVFCKGQVIPTSDDEGTIPIKGYEKYQTLISVIKDSYYTYDPFNQKGKEIENGNEIEKGGTINGETVANFVYLPDFSLRFPYGASDTLENSYYDEKIYGGESTVVVPVPQHRHEFKMPSSSGTDEGVSFSGGSLTATNTPYTRSSHTQYTGASKATINIIPPYTMINFIIKYE